jgi:hypothetical protein
MRPIGNELGGVQVPTVTWRGEMGLKKSFEWAEMCH